MYVNVVAYQMKDQVVVAVPPIGWDNELLTVLCIQKDGCPPLVTEDYLWIHTRESMSWQHLQLYFYQLGPCEWRCCIIDQHYSALSGLADLPLRKPCRITSAVSNANPSAPKGLTTYPLDSKRKV